MKFFACPYLYVPLFLCSFVCAHPVGSSYYYKDKSFLGSLESIMRITAREFNSFIEEYGVMKKSGDPFIMITEEQERALFSIDAQFNDFYKAVDNDDEVCDKLLMAFVGRTKVLALPYLSSLFMKETNLKARLEHWMTPNDVDTLRHKFNLLKNYIQPLYYMKFDET